MYFRNVSGATSLKALAHKGALTTEALGKFLATVSLDSDAAPASSLVDLKKDVTTLGIYRRSKKVKQKVKKATISGGKDFTADAEAAKKAKKPETAEELKAAFQEQRKKEQEKRKKMDAATEDFIEEADGEEETVEEEEDEEEEMI